MPNDHDLKIWPPFFARLLTGEKSFELRRNDRGFQEGDGLTLREWDPDLFAYTGRTIRADVLKVDRAEDVPEGLREGFALLEIRVRLLEQRGVVVTVQALQTWLRHLDHCKAVERELDTSGDGVVALDPDDPDCDCGLAEEWERRFFPLGKLGEVCQSLVAGEPFSAKAAHGLPPYWRDAVLNLAEVLRVKVLP